MQFITDIKQDIPHFKSKITDTSKNLWQNHRKKTIGGFLIIILVIFLIGKSNNNAPVNPYTVATANLVDRVVLSGRTESTNSVNLGFADSGRVGRVFVKEGQKVTQGQVLAELEMGDANATLLSAQAGLAIARANLDQANTNVDKVTNEQDSLVETAKRNLYGNLQAYPDDVFTDLAAPSVYGSYQGDQAGEYRLKLYSSTGGSGVGISYSGLENGTAPATVDTRVPIGTKGVFIQFPSLQGYANTSWVIPVPNNRSSAYAGLMSAYQTAQAARDRAIAAARADVTGDVASVLQARVDQAQASVTQAQSAISRRRIIAPFSGTISSVDLKEGESTIGISKDTSPGVSMLATDQYKVVIKIPEIDVSRISPNTPVGITLDAYGPDAVFEGVLASINPAETIVDGVPVYEGTVLFDKKDDRVRSGMTATVTIKISEKDGVIAIPGNYIREDKVLRKSFVTVVNPADDQKPSEREIKTGIRGSDGMTEVTDGLSVGEIIAGK